MGAINTEDAARRLARVILSDIDLYIRERPKLGESREAQIEEGRRLFASRVTPELAPLFAVVLADRAAGRVSAPVAAAAPAVAAVPAISATAAAAPPEPNTEFDDAPPTDPAIFVPFEHELPAPAAAQARVVAPPVPPPPAPVAQAQARVVAPAAAPEIPAPAPPAPVLTARLSIPRLLAIVSVVTAIVGVVHRFFR